MPQTVHFNSKLVSRAETRSAHRKIMLPTLYVWGTEDLALGETAAIQRRQFVTGPYRFEKLEGASHWLLEEVPGQVSALVLEHIDSNLVRYRISFGSYRVRVP
jgi:pimeloyl-ACP methyl ester carboxylesterase